MASLRMLGAKYGMYDPKDWKAVFYCDHILDAWVDIHDKTNGIVLDQESSQEQKGEKLQEVIEKNHIPLLKVMEDQLEKLGGPFITGPKLTIADCAMVAVLANIWENPAGPWTEALKPVLENYPKVQAYNLKLREAFADRLNDPERKAMPL